MSKVLLIIKGDWNDADYVYRVSELTVTQFNKIQPIIQKMADEDGKGVCQNTCDEYDGWQKEYPSLTDDELGIIEGYIPHGYEMPCHSIDEITVYDIGKKDEYI